MEANRETTQPPDGLTPLQRINQLRDRVAAAGITEEDVLAALAEAEHEPIEDVEAYEAYLKEWEEKWEPLRASALTRIE